MLGHHSNEKLSLRKVGHRAHLAQILQNVVSASRRSMLENLVEKCLDHIALVPLLAGMSCRFGSICRQICVEPHLELPVRIDAYHARLDINIPERLVYFVKALQGTEECVYYLWLA